ncbi:MAG TPA: response regulator [Thermoanaerobaculia bacterium]|jgi:PAS domain S-box-containing protein|nr:response regulator [Thermoanaerobaculia bacterium]
MVCLILVEDRDSDAELVERELRRGGLQPVITRVEIESELREALSSIHVDAILSDYHLPTFDGMSALRIARELAPDLPFIFVSGSIGEERAVEALRNGATDYVLKDRLARLPSAVTRALSDCAERARRRSAEKALRASEERFRYAMTATHDLIWDWDVATGTVWANRLLAHEDVLPEHRSTVGEIHARIHPGDRDAVIASIEAALANGASQWSLEYRLLGRDATFHRVMDRALILRDASGAAMRVIRALTDVTEHRAAEHERNELARRSELILDSVNEGIIGIDGNGLVMFANAAVTRLLGWTMDELLGKNVHEMVHHSHADGSPFPLEDCRIINAAQSGEVKNYESVFWRSDGKLVPVMIDCAQITDGGVVTGVVITFSDLSEHRLLERQLEQARRISGLGRIAATTAHEFNNVLMGIQPFADILERTIEDPRVRKIARHLTQSVQRGKSITHEILRFANDATLDLKPMNISPWLEALVGELRALLGTIVLNIELPEEELRISADSASLQQVVTNIVINARDAMTRGGTVTIRARRGAEDEVFAFVPPEHPSRFLHLSIADAGGGIPADVIEHIFEPMFTTKRKGNGLGLAFAHQAVMRHGGHIFVESTADVGATFHLFFALTSKDVADSPETQVSDVRDRNARVLLVEDDADVARATAAGLELAGFAIEIVSTGAAVVGGIETFRPDAVILDIGLPDESGFDVYDRVVARWPELPVIFASGHVVDTQRAATFGNSVTLTKPYRIAELVSAFLKLTAR